MSRLKPFINAAISVALPALLGACAAYRTGDVTPAPSRLLGVTTKSGQVLIFDSLPVPRIAYDTIYGHRDGVPYAIPAAKIAETRWATAPAESLATPAATPPVPPGSVAPLTVQSGASNAATALKVSLNHDDHVTALVLGGLLGAVGGAFAGYALRSTTPCDSGLAGFNCAMGHAFEEVGLTLLGGTVGAALGAVIADAIVPERWSTVVPLEPRVGVVPLPGRRLGLGVALAF